MVIIPPLDPSRYSWLIRRNLGDPSGVYEYIYIHCTHTARHSTRDRPTRRPPMCGLIGLATGPRTTRTHRDISVADPTRLYAPLRSRRRANGSGSSGTTAGGLAAAPDSGSGSGKAALGAGNARARSDAAAPRSMDARRAASASRGRGRSSCTSARRTCSAAARRCSGRTLSLG